MTNCRYCTVPIYRILNLSEYWMDYEGKYYCVSWAHGLTHEPVDDD